MTELEKEIELEKEVQNMRIAERREQMLIVSRVCFLIGAGAILLWWVLGL